MQRSSRLLWWTAAATSIGLLALVLLQVDWPLVRELARGMPTWILLVTLVGFGLEGVFTALRMRAFAPPRTTSIACLNVTAWYVLWLVVLPGRLGEVAAVGLMRRHLGMRTGQAATALIMQRLLDLIVLGSVLLGLVVVLVTPMSSPALLALLVVFVVGLVAAGCGLHVPLAWGGRLLHGRSRRCGGPRRALLRIVLGARTYHRHRLRSALVFEATLLTIAKWSCHLAAFALLFHGLELPLATATNVLLGAAYNCLAVVPLQTIGGIGVTEAGLLGLLRLFEVSTERAASTVVLVRVVLVAAPVLFWGLVTAASAVGGAARGTAQGPGQELP